MSLNGKKIQEKKRDEVDESVKEAKIEVEYEIGDLIELASIVQVIKIFYVVNLVKNIKFYKKLLIFLKCLSNF